MVAGMVATHTARFPSSLCFWDEPESHIGISLMQRFIIGLRRSAGKVGQLIATSQNPEAIRSFSQENVLIISRENHKMRPSILRASELKNKEDLSDAFARGDYIDGLSL
jgi:predicted ATPase